MTFSWLGAGIRPAAATAAIFASSIAAGAVEPAASDAAARMLRLSENVYVIEHDDATDEWPHGNTGVIVGQHRRLRDRLLLPALAREGRHRPHPPRDRKARSLPDDDALAFRPQQRRRRLPGCVSRRDPDCRAQHRALDRTATRTTGRRSRPRPAPRGAMRSRSSRRSSRAAPARTASPSARRSATKRAGVIAKRHNEFDELAALHGRDADAALRRPPQPRFRGHADRNRRSGPCEFTE